MRTDKTGDGRGRPRWRSSFVGDPGAIFSGGKRGTGQNKKKSLSTKENSVRSFYGCFSSLAEPVAAARSGQGRTVFWRGESAPLTEDSCESIGAVGKDLFSGMQDMCHHGGSKDE